MAQASIRWLLSHPEVASVTPTFRTEADIDHWAAAADTPPLSDDEVDRVEELYQENFGVGRDDGMSPEQFRTSVEGRDLERAGILPASSADD
jgi:diketogulonate reductase-like aldo/keto reductase